MRHFDVYLLFTQNSKRLWHSEGKFTLLTNKQRKIIRSGAEKGWNSRLAIIARRQRQPDSPTRALTDLHNSNSDTLTDTLTHTRTHTHTQWHTHTYTHWHKHHRRDILQLSQWLGSTLPAAGKQTQNFQRSICSFVIMPHVPLLFPHALLLCPTPRARGLCAPYPTPSHTYRCWSLFCWWEFPVRPL